MKILFDTKSTTSGALVVLAETGGKLLGTGQDIDKKTGGALKRAIASEKFQAKIGQTLVVKGASGVKFSQIVILGVGKVAELTLLGCEHLGSNLVPVLNGVKAAAADVAFDGVKLKKITVEAAAAEMGLGTLLRTYRFDKYHTQKTKDSLPTLSSLRVVLKEAAKAKKIFARHEKVAKGVFLTRDLVSEPPNVLYPESFAKIIQKEMKGLNVAVKVLQPAEMTKMGMGALMAVGQGSARPPRLVTMHYKGGGKNAKTIAFVGKGVTFDTGGISIKPSANMDEMKWDMGGAGTVTGLMKALAARKAKVNVVGIVGLAENMPSDRACRPGDVVTSMSGQTVEILNTDAEGRLVLCDALWYCQQKFKPVEIIDLATLTGAVIVALGHEYAGIFSNNADVAGNLQQAGIATGEHTWPMPMCNEWDKEINSPIADVKNIGAGRAAGSATAAHFLKRFIQKGVKWAHIDIAGVAWAYKNKTSIPKGGSGFGVRLLDRYVADNWEK